MPEYWNKRLPQKLNKQISTQVNEHFFLLWLPISCASIVLFLYGINRRWELFDKSTKAPTPPSAASAFLFGLQFVCACNAKNAPGQTSAFWGFRIVSGGERCHFASTFMWLSAKQRQSHSPLVDQLSLNYFLHIRFANASPPRRHQISRAPLHHSFTSKHICLHENHRTMISFYYNNFLLWHLSRFKRERCRDGKQNKSMLCTFLVRPPSFFSRSLRLDVLTLVPHAFRTSEWWERGRETEK